MCMMIQEPLYFEECIGTLQIKQSIFWISGYVPVNICYWESYHSWIASVFMILVCLQSITLHPCRQALFGVMAFPHAAYTWQETCFFLATFHCLQRMDMNQFFFRWPFSYSRHLCVFLSAALFIHRSHSVVVYPLDTKLHSLLSLINNNNNNMYLLFA